MTRSDFRMVGRCVTVFLSKHDRSDTEMADDRGAPHPLAQLLVTEAIREFEKRFEGTNNKTARIESQIRKLGRKPGFAMTSQLLRASTESVDGLEEIARFLGTKFTPAIFGVQPKTDVNQAQKSLRIMFDRLPSWFLSIAPPPSGGAAPGLSPEHFWWRSYASFLIGVYTGALVHLGQKVTSREISATEAPRGYQLILHFGLEELDGTWEFSAAST
jgi:hypothetical protein